MDDDTAYYQRNKEKQLKSINQKNIMKITKIE